MSLNYGLENFDSERKDYGLRNIGMQSNLVEHSIEKESIKETKLDTYNNLSVGGSKLIREELLGNIRQISDYSIVDIVALSRPPIPAKPIVDTNGDISKKIMEFEALYNCPVLPFRLLGLSPLVSELREHNIIEIDGEKYASNKTSTNREEEIVKFANDLVDIYLKRAREFEVTLMTDVEVSGIKFKTCLFSSYELQMLLGLLVNYQAKIAQLKNGDTVLLMGKFDYINI